MLVHPWDAPRTEADGWEFVRAQGFGHLIAAGRGRDVAVVVPTQYVVAGDECEARPDVVIHLAAANPIWRAIEENARVILAVAGDWAYIPAAWKALGDEDPTLGIPTTYYAAAQLTGDAVVVTEPDELLALLHNQLREFEPDGGAADPVVHAQKLPAIRGLRLSVDEVRSKFKYGGNVDHEHRLSVASHLADRSAPGDAEALRHMQRAADPPRKLPSR